MADGFEGKFFTALFEALTDVYDDPKPFQRMLKLKLGKNLSGLAGPGKLDDRIFEAMTTLQSEGSGGDDELDSLLCAAYKDRPDKPKLRQLYRRRFGTMAPSSAVGAAPSEPPADPFSAYRLVDALFLDRRELRMSLRAIESGGNRPVIVVRGPPRTGKTYTHELIRYVAFHLKHSVRRVDIRQPPEVGQEPAMLVRTILLRMGIKYDPPPYERVNQLLDWVVGQLGQLSSTWWIVIHNFESSGVSQDVRGFLMGLVDQVSTGLPNVRLALLDYDEAILPPFLDHVRVDTTRPIERGDMVEFFQGAFGATASSVIEKAIEVIWTKLPPENDPERLRALNELVTEAVERLFSREGSDMSAPGLEWTPELVEERLGGLKGRPAPPRQRFFRYMSPIVMLRPSSRGSTR